MTEPLLPNTLPKRVVIKRVYRTTAAFADSDAQALHIHLRQTFGRSHDIGRVDGFIGRDHDELVYVVLDCHIGYVTRTVDIRMDGFAGVLFHQGHMLVGGGMEDQLGMETLIDAFDTMDHANVSHDRGKLDIGEFFFQLQPDVMHRGFGTVEQKPIASARNGRVGDRVRYRWNRRLR